VNRRIIGFILLGLSISWTTVLSEEHFERSRAAQIELGDTPLNLIETKDGFLVSSNSGYGSSYLQAYDESRRIVSDRLDLPSLFYGLEYSAGHKFILASAGTHVVYAIPFQAGRFGKPHELNLKSCDVTAGLAIQDNHIAVAVCNQSHSVVSFNFETGRVLKQGSVGEYPYAVKIIPGERLAVSNWGESSVSILQQNDLHVVKAIPTGRHPNDLLLLPDNRLAIACSDSDSISLVDLHSLSESSRLSLRIPHSSLGGAQPDALAFDSFHRRLFVALARLDALAVFNFAPGETPKLQGLVPVGANPATALYSRRMQSVFIGDGRNADLQPSVPREQTVQQPHARTFKGDAGSALSYVGNLRGGGVEALSTANMDDPRSMLMLAQRVYGDSAAPPPPDDLVQFFSPKSNRNAPIRHVVYVIKENRTYDQILGDIKEGNGDPELTLFGEKVTPNQHALARKFVLYDNFYTNGDVSWDGHLWSTAAESTDMVDKLWPATYAHRVQFQIWSSIYRGNETHRLPAAAPGSGFLWDLASKAGVTYRDYGEWCNLDPKNPTVSRAYVKGLLGHYDPQFNPDIGNVSDQARLDEWEHEFRGFERSGTMPQLTILYLPNDHTMGTRPNKPTPRSMIADNDLAVGRLIEDLSQSRFWSNTAVFVLEDDSQDGPDHVDCHRSPLLVISPYARLGFVEHSHFSTVSVLKTIEQILGLGSLTYFDDRAPSLLVDFQRNASPETFMHISPGVPLDQLNSVDAPGAQKSARWNFSQPDQVPDQELNMVIWRSIKGPGSGPPAPVHSVEASIK
jgi:hypothetical protein